MQQPMLFLYFVQVLISSDGQCLSLMVELATLFALLLRLQQHGSHHTCSMNYTAFTSVTHWTVPLKDQFHEMASQSKLVTLPKLWRASCDLTTYFKRKILKLNNFTETILFREKRGKKKKKLGHFHL